MKHELCEILERCRFEEIEAQFRAIIEKRMAGRMHRRDSDDNGGVSNSERVGKLAGKINQRRSHDKNRNKIRKRRKS